MFYVKREIDGTIIKEEITAENVFTICPRCGKELQVDLAEVFPDGEIDLEGTSIICKDCTQMKEVISNKALEITDKALEMVDEGEDLDVVEAILSQDIEDLVEEYWNEVLYREERERAEKEQLEKLLGIDKYE